MMSSALNTPFTALIIFTLFLSGAFAAYLFLAGFRKRNEEQWDRRLSALSEEKFYDLRLTDWFAATFLGRKKKDNSSVISENSQILREVFLRQERGSKVEALYGPLLSGLGRDPAKWWLYYFGGKFAGILCGASIFWIILQQNYLSEFGRLEFGVTFGVFLIGGGLLPDMLAKKISQKRRDKIERVAPDVVDLLLLSVEAGMTFDNALSETKASLSLYAEILSKELEQLSAELLILPNRSDAFNNLVRRTGSDTLRYLSVALIQGEKYGTPIAASLRIVAQESRKRTLIEVERQAGRLPVLLSIPLMLLVLPPVVVVSAGPGFVSLMRSFGGEG